ncbi:asparagine synthetase domain-containing protein CG17486 [Drosophila serrata]|uniref:asparagine synthetase domain-containing protein CG17486 n=1 Tax=Drosophila serrata TaxID=7274 RepID=UPI000A1D11F3|nr:asparagine synthetase domain-containing protein CG17486 [Drosophila serrata]KAH8380717.1 hypothetical protein KR200_006749 [Drosophila serrata]
MCGILCAVSHDPNWNLRSLIEVLKSTIKNRGPDKQDEVILSFQTGSILLAGSVLWQQGANVQKQPIDKGDFLILCNGDFYNLQKPDNISDTLFIANRLAECINAEQIISVLKSLQGPHSLLIYDKSNQILYFSRDTLGRNSLIIERTQHGINLLSVSGFFNNNQLSIELPPLGIYQMKVNNLTSCVVHLWQPLNEYSEQLLYNLDAKVGLKTTVESIISPNWLLKKKSKIDYDFYKTPYNTDHVELYENLISQPKIKASLNAFDKLLSKSVANRVECTAPLCRICLSALNTKKTVCRHAKICILFSGGIDCTILAFLANKFVPHDEPIELINVAFESLGGQNVSEKRWDVPDRRTSLMSANELKSVCPERFWNFLEVNVTRDELKTQLSTRIKNLIYPLQTILDESLGCAYWFASNCSNSTARVALIGSGADELFGGYCRHRNAYKRCLGSRSERQLSVQKELDFDWQRLPARNLARDDRVIGDNGKTARSPFIEENIVEFVRSLEPYQKCCFNFPEGVGDKLLLRLYAYKIGLRDVALIKKRAIQFGSRIANKKENASAQSEHLKFYI